MSMFEVPEVPGVSPAAVRALTRFCYGEESANYHSRHPYIFYIEDDAYFCVTDGSTLVLLLLEHGLPPEIKWSEEMQTAVGNLLQQFSSTQGIASKLDIPVEEVLNWAASGTEECPKCRGKRSCVFPRGGAEGSDLDSEALNVHAGTAAGMILDRRRIQLVLKMLGVTAGNCDVSVTVHPEEQPTGILLLSGENWKVMTAPVTLMLLSDEREKLPRLF